jgi:hypothetical protein
MTYIKVITVYTIFLLCAQKLWKIDMDDRTHPYGLDRIKNERYAKKLVGEAYGVTVFWGKPKSTDTNNNRLDKIEWLSDSYHREVKWRRSLFFGILASFLISLMCNSLHIRDFLTSTIVISGFVYFSHVYYDHHINHFKNKYVKNHIKALKKEFSLDMYNPIYEHI